MQPVLAGTHAGQQARTKPTLRCYHKRAQDMRPTLLLLLLLLLLGWWLSAAGARSAVHWRACAWPAMRQHGASVELLLLVRGWSTCTSAAAEPWPRTSARMHMRLHTHTCTHTTPRTHTRTLSRAHIHTRTHSAHLLGIKVG